MVYPKNATCTEPPACKMIGPVTVPPPVTTMLPPAATVIPLPLNVADRFNPAFNSIVPESSSGIDCV